MFHSTYLDSTQEVLTFASSSKNRTNNSFLLYAQGVFFLCDVIITSFVWAVVIRSRVDMSVTRPSTVHNKT